MNRIILLGRLTKDPEVRITITKVTVCTFTLAVNRPFDKDNTDFINIVVWGKTAELCEKSLTKGQRLLVEGRLRIHNYTAKDGNKRYVTEVIADRVEFIEQREKTAESENVKVGQPNKQGFEAMGEEVNVFDENVPF